MLVWAALLVGLLGAPATARSPEDASGFTRVEMRLFLNEGLTKIAEYYLRPVNIGTLTTSGLQALSQIDPQIAVAQRGPSIHLLYGDTVAGSFYAPDGRDVTQWAELATGVVTLARSVSPTMRGAPVEDLYKAMFDNILTGLDRFSRYAGQAAAAEHRAAREGFGGIGVRVDVDDNGVKVIEILAQTPASRAGLRVGDMITRINGEPTRGQDQRTIITKLRGPPDTSVKLTLQRQGARDPLLIELTREHIYIQTVHYKQEQDVAVLRVDGFNQHTKEALIDAIGDAKRRGQGFKGVVLDLRGNPGGLLDQAVAIADVFLRDGRILETHGRHPQSYQRYDAHRDRVDVSNDLPIVTIVNGTSASAAEIVAAALQDSGRSVVVGTTSYGKGTVQTVITMPNQGELTLTWAKLHGPSGYSFHEVGVVPTVCSGRNRSPSELVAEAVADAPGIRAARAALRRTDGNDPDLVRRLRSSCQQEAQPTSGGDDRDLRVALELVRDPVLYARALQLTRPAIATTGTPPNQLR